MLSTEVLLRISKEVRAPVSRVEAIIGLLQSGATVPFIARYRKEVTGNLDESKIRDLQESWSYYSALEDRKATVLASIERQGKLTDELRQQVASALTKSELEDVYFPCKPKRKTRANAALERGLGPLADYIWEQSGQQAVEDFASRFVSPPEAQIPPPSDVVAEVVAEEVSGEPAGSDSELPPPDTAAPVVSVAEAALAPAPPAAVSRRVENVEDAIQGALHIIAERIAENAAFRGHLRDLMFREGVVRARVVEGKEKEKTKYEMYYRFEETVPKIPSHRMLAIRRGCRENVLTSSVDLDAAKFVSWVLPLVVRDAASPFAAFLERAVKDSYDRLLVPAIQNEVRSVLRERSEADAIRVFEENLRTLLLSPPAGHIGVIGIDPGMRTGCRMAVVDESGKFLESQTVHPTEPHKNLEAAEAALLDLIRKHGVKGIAIGNGSASRETEAFVRETVQKHTLDVFVIVVSEAGASVYSASKRAREEFPGVDVAIRGAISIARRLQDPLAELVKVEPRSIGVGQYQHDVDQKKLKQSLSGAVESCVNRVGVDLNLASADLLKYVSGIGEKLADSIVAYRTQHGLFRSRTQLMAVEGFDDKSFEQSAGFVRIQDGENPLDRTAIHPESYAVVQRIAEAQGIVVGDLVENAERIKSITFAPFEAESGKFTLADIREELLSPGRDPRKNFVVPKFRDDVKGVIDLKEGMELEGSVTNVTNFGAFVDLGIHQDGLVHISEMSHKYIQDAREAVKVGDIVRVKVIGVDPTMKRVSLSMKALLPKPPRRPQKKKSPVPDQPQPPRPTALASTPKIVASGPGPVRPPQPRPVRRPAAQAEKRGSTRSQQPIAKASASPPLPSQTMDEKIRALQQKFNRVG